MPWYAVEALDDAIETTKALLLPVEVRTWLKLAVVVFFLGGASASPPTGGGNFQFTGEPSGPTSDVPISEGTLVTVALVIAAVAILLWLLFTLVGSVMEFAFVEALRTREVHVRRYASDHLGQGLRLFGFRFALFLLFVLPVAGLVILAFVPAVLSGTPSIGIGVLLLLVPVLLVFGLVVAVVDGLTRNFVVPVMVLRGGGVLAGWRAFWPTLRDQWKQYVAYVLLRVVLTIAGGIVTSIVGGIVGLVLLIPFVVLGGLLLVAFGGPAAVLSSPGALALASFGLLVVVYGLLLLSAFAVIRVPVQSYLGYYALLVLGDTNREFDLVPELRAEIR
ncbi:DUF7544 domain-containing protein [Haladaptatus salinisoli]|uniref:DUF7544 domain-containing protein n=1 Tax=Haladaptatus salinisoli TaxID=2884876 RepID=UPI001D0AD2FD|nr:hypothetical protein [Haladaptatus salinisoli]